MPSFALTRSLGVDRETWTRFAPALGRFGTGPLRGGAGGSAVTPIRPVLRRRRVLRTPAERCAAGAQQSPLHRPGSRVRAADRAFADDPLLRSLLQLLRRVADCSRRRDRMERQGASVPHRSPANGSGRPTPEGMHRDGVTLVSSLLIRRRNAIGGESMVCDSGGRQLLRTTLAEPGTLLLGDDRRTLHGVSPISPDRRLRAGAAGRAGDHLRTAMKVHFSQVNWLTSM